MKYIQILINSIVSLYAYIHYSLIPFKKRKLFKKTSSMIIFSMDRPLQLKSLLLSIEKNIVNCDSFFVVYKSSKINKKRYDTLIKSNLFDKFKFINESNFVDFKCALNKTLELIKSSHVLFAVDDILIIDKVDFSSVLQYVDTRSIFSLRLGKDISYCYTEKKPQELPCKHINLGEIIAWKPKDAKYDFAYPMSVDCHFLPTSLIKIISKYGIFYAPNSFEGALSRTSFFIRNWSIVSYHYPKVLNLPINKVQTENENHHGESSIEDLNKKFDMGYSIDFKSIDAKRILSPHMEITPTLIKDQRLL